MRPFLLEGLAKRSGGERGDHPWRDAAAEIDAAPRAEGERNIAGKAAKPRDEHAKRFAGDNVSASGAGQDVDALYRRRASACRDSSIKREETGTRDGSLSRNVAGSLAKLPQNGEFPRVAGADRHVPAFASHGDPISSRPDQSRDAKPRAWTQHHLGRAVPPASCRQFGEVRLDRGRGGRGRAPRNR